MYIKLKSQGVKLNNNDILRIGKKLFKIWRIEIESNQSKEKFLKKAKKVSVFGKNDISVNLNHKIVQSNTTRFKEDDLLSKIISKKRKKEKEKTFETDNLRKEMLFNLSESKLNTSNINNTEGFVEKKIAIIQTLQNQTKEEQNENSTFGKSEIKKMKTENLDDKENIQDIDHPKMPNKNEKNFRNSMISESEIDLEGVYSAEHNEFIKVMVSFTPYKSH